MKTIETQTPLKLVLSRLEGVHKSGDGYQARCPAHDDRKASLSVREASDGKILVYCHAGCPTEAVLQKVGLTMKDLFEKENLTEVATYDYVDEDGQLLFQTVRYRPKAFKQRRPDGRGGWIYNLQGTKRVLYRLPEVIKAVAAGDRVWVVEGEKDCERLASLGLAATTNPMGAGKWRSAYSEGLRGAKVVIIPDNDDPGCKHAETVARSLQGVATSVKVLKLPGLPPKGDVSDWLEAGGDAEQLRLLADRAPEWAPLVEDKPAGDVEAPDREGVPYIVSRGAICHAKPTRDGSIAVPLCNFNARIIEEAIRDDGAERTCVLGVEGALSTGELLPRVEVPADRFAGMNWVTAEWGTRPVVYAGQGTKDHLRAGIQLLSGEVPRRLVFAHAGWRKVNGAYAYLHQGGAIGPGGPVSGIEVSFTEGRLSHYSLPDPPEGGELVNAVRASLELLDLGPGRIMVPLLAATYRAPLGECDPVDLSLFVTGRTGTFKTALTALVQAHYGEKWSGDFLPANWSATANSLERLAFLCKDTVLVIDDFCPSGTFADMQSLHRDADRVFRAQANRAGRGRMRPDGSLRPDYYPRGLVVASGEDVPRGHSLQARLVILEVEPGNIDVGRLSKAQDQAATGLLAQAMAGYLRWLAPRIDALKETLPASRFELRRGVDGEGMHRRTSAELASLAAGWDTFLHFAQDASAITEEDRDVLWHYGWRALSEVAGAQAEYHAHEEPTGRFLALLSAAISSGRAHIADAQTGREPEDAERWGWQRRTESDFSVEWRALGERVGWIEEDDLLLEPEAAYAVAQRLARDQGGSLSVGPRALWKRMGERGYLLASDPGKRTTKRTVGAERRRVVCLHIQTLLSPEMGAMGAMGAPPTAPTVSGPEKCPHFSGDAENGGSKMGAVPASSAGAPIPVPPFSEPEGKWGQEIGAGTQVAQCPAPIAPKAPILEGRIASRFAGPSKEPPVASRQRPKLTPSVRSISDATLRTLEEGTV